MKNKYFAFDIAENTLETFETEKEMLEHLNEIKHDYVLDCGKYSPSLENILFGKFTHKVVIDDEINNVFMEDVK